MTPTNYIIIVAGGSGSRMNAGIPKQFLPLGGKPMLMHTIEKFFSFDPGIKIIVVLPEKEIPEWKSLCDLHNFAIAHVIEKGGTSRFQSVKNGLDHITESCIVGVHDGVRPFASIELIKRCFSEARIKGNAVPCVPLQDSIRSIGNGMNKAVDRNSLVSIQTPQCFTSEMLKKAYQSEFNDSFTDDASVVESAGEKINLVEGERDNIKITFPQDMESAKMLFEKQA